MRFPRCRDEENQKLAVADARRYRVSPVRTATDALVPPHTHFLVLQPADDWKGVGFVIVIVGIADSSPKIVILTVLGSRFASKTRILLQIKKLAKNGGASLHRSPVPVSAMHSSRERADKQPFAMTLYADRMRFTTR
jgi:hypothetical protein